ncbi:MAG: phosphate transport system regulatory protein PhoU [Porticoccaceae bacterium]|nr:MAG: phosphate transport system regulatory protein PhoU [Porticoccaceae bacterium]
MDKLQLDQHISKQFDADLEDLKSRMLEMGGLVERQVADALRAVEAGDSELALKVLENETAVDRLEVSIDEEATLLIARRQPAASDLRMVMAVSRCVRDLERVGDEAKKIAKMAIQLSEEGGAPKGCVEVRHMGQQVQQMLARSLDAFARFDAEAALAVLPEDRKVDLDFKSAIRELVTYMMEDPRSISRVLNVLWTLKAVERIGDHAKNICEQVVYLVRGRDIRHTEITS